jgi:hypothetical protein
MIPELTTPGMSSVHAVRRYLSHHSCGAEGAHAPALAGKRDQEIMTTTSAAGTGEAMRQNPTSQIPAQSVGAAADMPVPETAG